MQQIGSIRIEEYNYELPDERIAKFPLAKRDQSKLLLLKEKSISERRFYEIPDLLPENSLLVFNETKVIRARLQFRKTTGALIEVFCLEPIEPTNDFQLAFQENSSVVWKCLVGNAKRWKSGELELEMTYNELKVNLKATLVEKLSDSFLISFSWQPTEITFSEIIEMSGSVPLPPYLNREAEESDKKRYQTVYAKFDGSVAAPTAGLHFTDSLLSELNTKGIITDTVTLHVGAGTFRPVVSNTIDEHEMHAEKIVVELKTLKHLLHNIDKQIIPVGTTSMRTIESLYSLAIKIKNNNYDAFVGQWDPYRNEGKTELGKKEALEVLIHFLEKGGLSQIKAETQLMIAPGYQFRFAKGLITNFHQPKSTLLLLVSALIGEKWKNVYEFAMSNDFRFLSYGDSCLFLPSH